jgi:G3E family GTPase
MNRPLPVTLVGGFLGAGKTSFLHHLIGGHEGGNLVVFIENQGPLNFDAKAIRGLCGAMGRKYDKVLEIPAGDEAMQIEWMADRLRECSLAGRFERALIEASGVGNAMRFGRCFGLLPGHSEKFSPWAGLHQAACIVDALDFFHANGQSSAEAIFGDFQNEQIAGASLLILNKCDLVNDAEREACMRRLRSINPDAPIVETAYGEVPAKIWSRPGTLQELRLAVERGLHPSRESGNDISQAKEVSLDCTLYRAYRPFHPGRFWEWFHAEHPGLLRVKGLVWLATRNLLVGGISRTRRQNGCGGAGIWWAALPREEWPGETEALARMQETWREPYGDRRQELMLIGSAGQLAGIIDQLNHCLLDAGEYARPIAEWTKLPDPFPAWDLESTS